jgi:hypothetical protein
VSLKFALDYDKPKPAVKFNKFVISDLDLVGRCRLNLSEPVLKALIVSALEPAM